MISVIIPLYNGAAYIGRSIRSVLNQTFQDFEIVVVDDGSTDDGPQRAASFGLPCIRIVRQANGGVSAARNTGIREARYGLIAFLDADDEWLPDHLETIVRLYHTYPQCGVFGTSYYFQRGNEQPRLPLVPDKFHFTGDEGILDNYYELASGTDFPMQTSAYAVRKETILSIGGFPTGIPSGEDILTLARLRAVCEFAYCRKPSSIYYLTTGNNKSHRPILKKDPLDAMFDALYRQASRKQGIRLFLSSWHKRRMSGAILAHKYGLGMREFWKAFCIFPFQKKLYTSLLVTLFASVTGMSLYEINKRLKQGNGH